MPRPSASVPPDAIRIEDEVWQEAFTRREPARPRAERRLHAIEGGRSVATRVPPPRSAGRPAPPSRRTTAAQPLAPPPPPVAARQTLPPPAQAAPRPQGGVPGRRTVTIRGQGAERNLAWAEGSRTRPQRRAYERPGFRPDRVAMWAVLLGILLVVVAIASAHG